MFQDGKLYSSFGLSKRLWTNACRPPGRRLRWTNCTETEGGRSSELSTYLSLLLRALAEMTAAWTCNPTKRTKGQQTERSKFTTLPIIPLSNRLFPPWSFCISIRSSPLELPPTYQKRQSRGSISAKKSMWYDDTVDNWIYFTQAGLPWIRRMKSSQTAELRCWCTLLKLFRPLTTNAGPCH